MNQSQWAPGCCPGVQSRKRERVGGGWAGPRMWEDLWRRESLESRKVKLRRMCWTHSRLGGAENQNMNQLPSTGKRLVLAIWTWLPLTSHGQSVQHKLDRMCLAKRLLKGMKSPCWGCLKLPSLPSGAGEPLIISQVSSHLPATHPPGKGRAAEACAGLVKEDGPLYWLLLFPWRI